MCRSYPKEKVNTLLQKMPYAYPIYFHIRTYTDNQTRINMAMETQIHYKTLAHPWGYMRYIGKHIIDTI